MVRTEHFDAHLRTSNSTVPSRDHSGAHLHDSNSTMPSTEHRYAPSMRVTVLCQAQNTSVAPSMSNSTVPSTEHFGMHLLRVTAHLPYVEALRQAQNTSIHTFHVGQRREVSSSSSFSYSFQISFLAPPHSHGPCLHKVLQSMKNIATLITMYALPIKTSKL